MIKHYTQKNRLLQLAVMLICLLNLNESFGQASITTYASSRSKRTYDTSYSVSGYFTTTAGLVTGTTTDDGSYSVTLPFLFSFNGSTYSKITMCTNGWLGLGDVLSSSFTASNGFSTNAPNNIIMPWFRDNNMNSGINVTGNGGAVGCLRYGNADSSGVFIAEWRNVASNGSGSTSATLYANYQVWLWGPSSSDPGRIEIHYGPTGGAISTGAAVGLEDSISGSGRWVNMSATGSGRNTATTRSSAYPGADSLFRFVPPPYTLGSVSVQQQTAAVTQGFANATILRVDLPVTGINGNLQLNRLRFNTQNTSNADILSSGVKLWVGTSNGPTTQIGTSQSIVGDSVVFTGLTTNLVNGTNYLWLTYSLDIATSVLGNQLDALIPTDGITISSTGGAIATGTIPVSDLNPSGSRTITVPMTYTSTTLQQQGNSYISPIYDQNTTNNPIVCIKVLMSNTGSPIPLTAISFTTTGSNNLSTNLQNAKIYYTGSSNVFATTTQFGSTIGAIAAGNNRVTGSVNLVNDTNYLWLTFDVKSAAIKADTIDATIDTVTINGSAQVVSPKAPTGYSQVGPLQPKYTVTQSTGISYTSIMSTGNTYTSWVSLTSGDDNTSNEVTMPFSFNYLGRTVTSFRQCTNGWLTLNGQNVNSVAWTNTITGNSSTQNTILAPMWDDLVMTGQNLANANSCMRWKVDTITTSPLARVLTVEWAGMERFNQSSPNLNFQVKLYEGTNNIEYRYGEMTGFTGSSAITYTYTIGLNNSGVSTLVTGDYMSLQQARTDRFSNSVAQNGLTWLPECNSSYLFVPGNIATGTSYPSITNNECSGAIGINVATTAAVSFCQNFTSKGATASSGIPACSAASPGTPDDDVWFTFNNPQTQDVTIELASGNGYDGVFQLFSGSCGSLTPISCVNATGTGLLETYTATALTSGNYFVRVYHAGSGFSNVTSDSGIFNINIFAVPPPANDNCSGAHQLTVNGTTCSSSRTDTTAAATASSQSVCTGTATKDVWYYFQATATNLDVTVTPGNVSFNGVIQVFNLGNTNNCSNAITGNQIACVNNASAGQNEVANLSSLTVNNYYAVRVYHFLGGAGGNGKFTICVTTPPVSIGTIVATQQTGIANVNSSNNPIMRINIPTIGLIGNQTLNSITVTSSNTTDADVTSVKLWKTTGTTFTSPTQIGSSTNFSGGTATFSSLNNAITGANSYFWITYNVSNSATLGNTLDLSISSGDINISATNGAASAGTLPVSTIDPSGNVIVGVNLDYNITRSTGITYNTIMSTGNSFGFTSTNGDDQTSPEITMPFTFVYKGQTVTSFRACTNGWMTLNGSSVTDNEWTNAIDQNTGTLNTILAPFWDDLVCTGYQAPAYYSSASQLDQSLKYLVSGSAPNRVLTVEWAGMEKFTEAGPSLNFQVKLYENGNKIQYIYGNMGAFDGTDISEYSYSIGMNGQTTTTAGAGEFLSLQEANSDIFSAVAQDELTWAPNCYTMYEFTNGTHPAGTPVAAITNDESNTATSITVDTDAPTEICTSHRTFGATNSGISATSGTPDDDVWFTFNLASPKAVQFDLRSGPEFDGVFEVFNSSLVSLTPAINKTGLSLSEDTILNLSAGTYFLRVFHNDIGYTNSTSLNAQGEFAIFAYDAPVAPVNDDIAGMILLNSNTSCVLSSTQKTIFATASSQAACTGTPSKDVWYYFQAGYSSHNVTVTPVTPGTTFNPVVQIYNLGATANTANAISGNQVACQNNAGTNASEVVSLTTLVPGNYYAVRVYHFTGGAGGTGRFKICVANPVGFWSGNTSSNWTVGSNWSNGIVPTSATNVRIGAGRSIYPNVTTSALCNNLTIDTATSLTINNGGNLQVNGTVTAPTSNFTYTHNSGWLTLNAPTNLPAWNYFALRLTAATGTYTMLGNTTVNDYFINNGGATVATAGYTLTCKKDITNNGTISGLGKVLCQRASGYSTFAGVSTGNYDNIEIDVTSGGARFAQNMQINGTLTLTSGTVVINPSLTITVGTTSTSTGNIISSAATSIIGGSSATSSTLAILGDASAPQVTNLIFNSNGNFTLNRPSGVKLGGNSAIGSILTLTNGTIEQNGFNLNIGSTSLSTVSVNRTYGKIKNSLNTGTLYILGNASAANVSTLNLDTVNSILVNIQNGFTVDSLFYVKTLASITKGFVDLNGTTITLGTNASVSEAANQTFRGNSGSITTTRTYASALSNNNVAGLGLKLSTNGAPGVTTLTRKHNVYTSFSGSSIKRNFTITSANTVTASLFAMSYDSTELLGADRSKLRFNKSTNNGASWSDIAGSTPSTANNPTGYVTRNGVIVLNSTATVYTLSDSANTPLSPVFTNNTATTNSYTNQINGVYPNPFINELTIDFVSEVNSLSSVRMTDINGKVVYNGNFATQQGQNLMNINGANLASGVYMITLMNNNEVKTIRVIKQ